MTTDTLLLPVFDYLRKQGVPLGVSEYCLAVETVRAGVGIESVAQLKRLCSLLWAKSREDQELLDIAFAECVEPQLETLPVLEVVESPGSGDEKVDEDEQSPAEAGISASGTPSVSAPEGAIQRVSQRQLQVRPAPLGRASPVRSFPLYHSVKYHLIPRLPLSRRDMAGCWRQFRRFSRSGPPEDLDVEATIAEICQTGLLLHPVLRPRRRNQAGLLLLIDRQGSMAPFSPFVDALVESILRGGMLGRVQRYYFHDCPKRVLFSQPNLTQSVSLEEALSHQAKDNSVLVVSDAGAARGDVDGRRIEDTRRFVGILGGHTYLYAWLNPVPVRRWSRTTAAEIARRVPMFPLDRDGLTDAIKVLLGKPYRAPEIAASQPANDA